MYLKQPLPRMRNRGTRLRSASNVEQNVDHSLIVDNDIVEALTRLDFSAIWKTSGSFDKKHFSGIDQHEVEQAQKQFIPSSSIDLSASTSSGAYHGAPTKDVVFCALRKGNRNAIRVAYDLLFDAKTSKRLIAEREHTSAMEGIASPPTFSPGNTPVGSPMIYSPLSSTPKGLSQSLTKRKAERRSMGQELAHRLQGIRERKKSNRRRWYLGIQSKKEPSHVMMEVYRVLQILGFEWRNLSPYRVEARHLCPAYVTDEGNSKHFAMIILQLFKVQHGIYLLDFQRSGGDVFNFSSLCTRIIKELKNAPATNSALAHAAAARQYPVLPNPSSGQVHHYVTNPTPVDGRYHYGRVDPRAHQHGNMPG